MWLKLETHPELEFEFYIAERLGYTLRELREKLSQEEFEHWKMYYARKAQKQELAAARARR